MFEGGNWSVIILQGWAAAGTFRQSIGGRALSRVSPAAYRWTMCRNIRTLHNFEPHATSDEVHAAALQYVRKIAGTTKPSQTNAEAFKTAVEEIAHTTQHLLDELVTTAPPKDREVEAEKRRARYEARA